MASKYYFLENNTLVERTSGSFQDDETLIYVATPTKTVFRTFHLPEPATFSHLTGGIYYDNMILYKMRFPLQGWSLKLSLIEGVKYKPYFLNTKGVEAFPKDMTPFYQKLVWLARKNLKG